MNKIRRPISLINWIIKVLETDLQKEERLSVELKKHRAMIKMLTAQLVVHLDTKA